MQELIEWLKNNGFDVRPQLDGKVHRFKRDGKEQNAWYIGSEITTPKGKTYQTLTVGDWSTGEKLTFTPNGGRDMSDEAVAWRKKEQEKQKQKAEEELVKRQAHAAEEAKKLWESAHKVAHDDKNFLHPYLVRKKILVAWETEIKQNGNLLIIPMYQKEGDLCGLEFISEDGTKRFLTGTKKMGAFCTLTGEHSGQIAICEGFATACSIREATGITAVVAFDCGNLERVGQAIRELYPSSKIYFCADNDRFRKNRSGELENIGRNKAIAAADACGGRMILPVFPEEDTSGTDWNDLHVVYGLERVREQIEKQLSGGCGDARSGEAKSDSGNASENKLEHKEGAPSPGSEKEEKPKKEKKKKAAPVAQKTSSPYAISRRFLEHFGYLVGDDCNLRYYQQDFYRYKENHYQVIDDEWLKDKLNRWLVDVGLENMAGTDKVKPVLNMIKTKPVYLGSRTELPCLVDECWKAEKVSHLVPLKNGLFNIKKFARNKELELLPHTSNFFCRYVLPYEFSISAECPTYDKLVSEIFNSEEEIAKWDEVMGIHIYMPFLIEKFFILCGEGANGKSVLRTILGCLLGEDNVSTVPLESFNPSSFAFINTVGKLANVIPDMKDIGEIDEGVLKQFVSREPMMFNRKNKPFISAVPTAFLTVCTNVLPRFTDRSEGIWRRMMIFNFTKEIPVEKQNPLLREARFWNESGELPGIFNRALAGILRVIEREGIQSTERMDNELNEYRHELNFVMQFATEFLVFNKDIKSKSSDVYSAYKKMVSDSGGRALGAPAFSRQLRTTARKMGYDIDFSETNKRLGSYVGRIWYGVQLKLEEPI